MRSFRVIGCSHGGEEAVLAALATTLEGLAPDQLILEIPDDAAEAGALGWQSPEMVWAHDWAHRHGVPVRGYEPEPRLSILRAELGPDRIAELVEAVRRLGRQITPQRAIDLYSRGAAPQTPVETRLKVLDAELIDPAKAMQRTQAIISNIKVLARKAGTIVILCGASHTPHIAAALEPCEIVRGAYFY
jgi:hypothetical protein